jgi:hypothetical protein
MSVIPSSHSSGAMHAKSSMNKYGVEIWRETKGLSNKLFDLDLKVSEILDLDYKISQILDYVKPTSSVRRRKGGSRKYKKDNHRKTRRRNRK